MDKFVNSFDRTRLYYNYSQGKNPHTLVFLHGVGSNWTIWKKELDFFQGKEFSTLALDLRGHGASQYHDAFEKYKIQYFSRDVNTILRMENINQFSLVGHSIGGGVAINYVMRYKSVFPSSLILIDSASTYPFDHNRLLNMSPYLTHFLRFIASHPPTLHKHFLHFKDVDLSVNGIKNDLHLISHLLHFTPLRSLVRALDNLEAYVFHNQKKIDTALHNLRIPTLVISGQYDATVPVKFAKMIKRLNQDAQLKIIRGGHHTVMVEKPEQVNTTIYNFLQKQVLLKSLQN